MVLAMDLTGPCCPRTSSRLESAEEVAMGVVDGRPFDRIGVVAYEGGHLGPRSPPTTSLSRTDLTN